MTPAEAQWMLFKGVDDCAVRIRVDGRVLAPAEVHAVTRGGAMHGPTENIFALPESIEVSVEDIERVMRETSAPPAAAGAVDIANPLHERIRAAAEELGPAFDVMAAKERDRAICAKIERQVSCTTIKTALKGTPYLKARKSRA